MKRPESTSRVPNWHRFLVPAAGLVALVWFLIRVIPKPSRATYPCMRVAYPVASTFVVFLIGLATTAFSLERMRHHARRARPWLAAAFAAATLLSGFIAFQADAPPVFANSSSLDTPNIPVGEARGIFPGRVVWSRDVNATNENTANNAFDDIYYLPKNTDIDVVDGMVRGSLLRLTGTTSVATAWDSLFVFFNAKRGRGAVGYQAGEKIFLRINGIGSVVKGPTDHNFRSLTDARMARTSPQPVLALLRTLITDCGIPQENISVGDPMKDISNDYWDLWTAEFPNVRYICNKGGQGRVKAVRGAAASVSYSDRGSVLRTGGPFGGDMSLGDPVYEDTLYTVVEQADYTVYVAALKVHERAGITALGKLDFGSQARVNAKHLHMGLINPDEPLAGNKNSRFGYGLYRVQVDLLGHRKLGGNAVLYFVDALWSGTGANKFAVKFQVAPFNNDWPSSIFVSQDPIALESVCYDIMKAEFTSERHADATYPQMVGVDDYLHQAADSAAWPAGVRYDPENDGTVIGSLGVHEHWNNATAMEYTRNLGTGNGIELVKLFETVGVAEAPVGTPRTVELDQNHPNPFNPATVIRYRVSVNGERVQLRVYDLRGREVAVLVDDVLPAGEYRAVWNADAFPSAVYFSRLTMGLTSLTRKMVLVR